MFFFFSDFSFRYFVHICSLSFAWLSRFKHENEVVPQSPAHMKTQARREVWVGLPLAC